MKLTQVGSDYVCISESNLADESLLSIPRIHIIKLDFKEPTMEKVSYVLNTFRSTNRFVIDNNIKFYNSVLKNTNKKYYVANNEGDTLITFFKRNNKVLLDTTNLSVLEKAFVFSVSLADVLNNTEVIIVERKYYKEHPEPFNKWSGNLILV
jgi:CRISPR type III-B/RAMP module RAMP protein Cmr1